MVAASKQFYFPVGTRHKILQILCRANYRELNQNLQALLYYTGIRRLHRHDPQFGN